LRRRRSSAAPPLPPLPSPPPPAFSLVALTTYIVLLVYHGSTWMLLYTYCSLCAFLFLLLLFLLLYPKNSTSHSNRHYTRYVFLSLFSRVHHFIDDDVFPLFFSAEWCLALFFGWGHLSPCLRRLQRRANLLRPGLGRNVRPGREADEKPRRDVRHGFFYVRKPRRVRRRARRHHGNVHGRRRRRDDDGTCSRLRSFPSHLITSHLRLVFLVTSDFWIVSRDAYQSSSSNTDKTISLSSRILLLPLLLLLYRIRWT